MNVSIIIPVVREESAHRCIDAIKRNAGIPQSSYEIVTEVDVEGIGCPRMVEKLTKKTKYDIVMFLGDDTVPQKDFLKNAIDAMRKLPDEWGVVGLATEGPCHWLDNLYDNVSPLAHWMAHKKILQFIPGGNFFSTDYRHCYCDNELKDIADELGRWIFAENSCIQHIHPINKNAEYDKYYQKAYSDIDYISDHKTYCFRKRERMAKKYGTKLAICLPLTDTWVYVQFFYSFIKVITEYMSSLVNDGKKINFDVLMPDYPSNALDEIRNHLVFKALYSGCTHILMMDTDQIYNDDNIIERLLSHNKPVVGARVHRRYPPFDPLLLRGEIGKLYCISNNEIQKADGSFEKELPVNYTGTGCILYDTRVFIDMIPEKWFKFKVGDKGQAIGEDVGFCEKLNQRGIPIVVDCSIDIQHITLMAVDWNTYRLFQKIYKRRGDR